MNHHELDQHLRTINEIEAKQLQSEANVNDVWPIDWQGSGEVYFRMPDEIFFSEKGPIHIRKHNRFAPMPLHHHSFIEMNYIYSGQCIQWINGEQVVLREGQLCLLDTEVMHRIETMEENDILINIIMKKDIFTSVLGKFSSKGIVSNFFANAISESTNHNRYILFESEKHENLHLFLKNLMCEAFDSQIYSQEMIYHYMMIIYTELMRVYTYHTNEVDFDMESRASLIHVLEYIEANYQTCTLPKLAQHFNYNSNYLGNLLKKRTGNTFMGLIKTQRMIHAASLLVNTGQSIEDVAHGVGYSSLGFFYRAFADHFHTTPSKFRKQNKL